MRKRVEKVKDGDHVIARVVMQGSKNPEKEAWRYTRYEADSKLKSGYRFLFPVTGIIWPNKANEEDSYNYECNCPLPIVYGRPIAGENAPEVEK